MPQPTDKELIVLTPSASSKISENSSYKWNVTRDGNQPNLMAAY